MSTIVRKKTGRGRTLTWVSAVAGLYTNGYGDCVAAPACSSVLTLTTLLSAFVRFLPYEKALPVSNPPPLCLRSYEAGIEVTINDGHGGTADTQLASDTWTQSLGGDT